MTRRHPRPTRRVLALVAALSLTVATAACGDDDGAGAPAAGAAAGDDTAAGSCEGTSVTGSSPSNDSFAATSATGVSLQDGKAYTIYIADFDLSTDDVSAFSTPTVPEGGTMAIVAVTVFDAEDINALEPIAPGQVIEYTAEWGELTFVVTITDDSGTHGVSTGADGTATVTAVGDTFCGSVAYTDGEKALSGTFEAVVKAI